MLGGSTYSQFTTQRNQLLSLWQGLTPTSSCTTSLTSALSSILDPTFGSVMSQVSAAISNQLPYNGNLNTLSMYDTGMFTDADKQLPIWPSQWQGTPVCQQYYRPSGSTRLIVALAQASPTPANQSPINHVYYSTQEPAVDNLTQSVVLHERLHNLTRLGDANLYRGAHRKYFTRHNAEFRHRYGAN